MIRESEMSYLNVNNYKFFYNNKKSAMQTINEIFSDKHYEFATDEECPVILDCGSNIGIATVFFKIKYPKAKIICFEPDAAAFAKLKQNVAINQLNDVSLVRAALFNKKGNVDFFGQIDVKNPDTRGNSVCSDWGMQRVITKSMKVPAVCLSDYITDTIDFLKLDIEGAEQLVLEELGDKLNLIKQAIIEVHIVDQIESFNNLDDILTLLKRYNFKCEYREQDTSGIWHNAVKDWVSRSHPKLYSIRAKK